MNKQQYTDKLEEIDIVSDLKAKQHQFTVVDRIKEADKQCLPYSIQSRIDGLYDFTYTNIDGSKLTITGIPYGEL